MTISPLDGLSILVVEDQPLVALDINQTLSAVGARITTTNTLQHAMILAEFDGLSAAVLDHALGDGTSDQLYRRLNERGIPFLVYSGFTVDDGVPSDAPFLQKPAAPGALVAAMEELVRANPRRL